MSERRISGDSPFRFTYRDDLRSLPPGAQKVEEQMHGGFAVDGRDGQGYIYYGMPGHGLMKVSPDLGDHETIELPRSLQKVNFHATKIGLFDGAVRLILPANNDAEVAVLTTEGELQHIFEVPEFDEYRKEGVAFRPTDVALAQDLLFVADGYGANYITTANPGNREWTSIFGGKTDDDSKEGLYGTAHGLNSIPTADGLAIADRPYSRIQLTSYNGAVKSVKPLPAGSRPCGIDFRKIGGQWMAVVASLDDPDQGRPAPIYVLDAEYQVVSTIRPKDDLGIELADHIHNAVWHEYNGSVFLICQAWKPGFYFVLEMEV